MEYILPKEKLIEYAKPYFKAKGFKKRQSLDKGYWRIYTLFLYSKQLLYQRRLLYPSKYLYQ